jgi:CheY-like chemotaxis protein
MTMKCSRPTVLFVDDDVIVRFHEGEPEVCEDFVALLADDADAVVRALEETSKVDILLTDASAPSSVSGLALAEEVLDRCPNVGIMIATGQVANKETRDNFDLQTLYPSKPLTHDQLISALLQAA